MAPVYALRADVMSALEPVDSVQLVAQVDRALDAASRSVENLCHRYFYPWVGSRDIVVGTVAGSDYTWAANGRLGTWREYLRQDTEATTISTVSLDGTTLTEWWAGPQNPDTAAGTAPYSYLDLTSAIVGVLTLTGVFGACQATATATTLNGSVLAGATSLAVADSSSVGPGALVKVDSEWLTVTGQTWSTTGQALTVALTDSVADVLVQCATPASLAAGEVLTVGAEQLLVRSVTGAGATVQRAYGGTVLATHAIAAVLYAPRTLTVDRAQCGTTAAAHADAAAVARHRPPALVRDLTIAEALHTLAQEASGYARMTGSGDSARGGTTTAGVAKPGTPGIGLDGLRAQVRTTHGRTLRKGVI